MVLLFHLQARIKVLLPLCRTPHKHPVEIPSLMIFVKRVSYLTFDVLSSLSTPHRSVHLRSTLLFTLHSDAQYQLLKSKHLRAVWYVCLNQSIPIVHLLLKKTSPIILKIALSLYRIHDLKTFRTHNVTEHRAHANSKSS
jgi:hypothetical protein